jgi:hypothetical protein
MRRSEIHRKALRGAAAVAFTTTVTTTLWGCGRVDEGPKAVGGESKNTTGAPKAAATATTTETATATDVGADAPEPTKEVVAETSETDAGAKGRCAVKGKTDKACCAAAGWPGCDCRGDGGGLAAACCNATDWRGIGCTPWGPPTPPIFSLDDDDLEVA